MWSGYRALVAAGRTSSLPPYNQVRQEYKQQHIGTGETIAENYEGIRQCASPTLASREGRISGTRTIVDLVPIKGLPEKPISLSFVRWEGTQEWWVQLITETTGVDGFICVQVPQE